MNGPSVLVTGATGTVGSALVPALQARGVSVRAMSRTPGRLVSAVENVVADLGDPESVTAAPIGDAAVRLIDTRDIADTAAAVLTGTGHTGQTCTLTGPRAVTHHEIAQALSTATGRNITFQDASVDQFTAALAGILPPWQLDGLVEDYAHYARGEAAEVHSSVPDLTGHPARDITDFARDYAAAFTAA